MLSFSKKYHKKIDAGKSIVTSRGWNTLNAQKNTSSSHGFMKVLYVRPGELSAASPDEIGMSGVRSADGVRSDLGETVMEPGDFSSASAGKIRSEHQGGDIEDRWRLMGRAPQIIGTLPETREMAYPQTEDFGASLDIPLDISRGMFAY